MKRITFTADERGCIHQIYADEVVEVYIADPNVARDRVYCWNSLQIGPGTVDEEIGG